VFIEAISQLVDDPERRRLMGISARAFVEDWISPAAVAASYERLFEEVRTNRHSGKLAPVRHNP
jgi:glycosyltransferase involved in cell wall biosynthesis